MATDWRIAGEEVGSCNCAWGCPCQFNALPTNGNCEAVIVWDIRQGHFGDTDLSGTRYSWIVHWPGAIHEGDGTRQVIIDDGASQEQRAALEALMTGAHGGTVFEIFNEVCPNQPETLAAKIEFESDRESRVASFTVGELAESKVEPIRNPVDGSEHRARIDLPDGFEYKIAEIGNTVSAKSNADAPLNLSLENSYAQLNEFDWSPA